MDIVKWDVVLSSKFDKGVMFKWDTKKNRIYTPLYSAEIILYIVKRFTQAVYMFNNF